MPRGDTHACVAASATMGRSPGWTRRRRTVLGLERQCPRCSPAKPGPWIASELAEAITGLNPTAADLDGSTNWLFLQYPRCRLLHARIPDCLPGPRTCRCVPQLRQMMRQQLPIMDDLHPNFLSDLCPYHPRRFGRAAERMSIWLWPWRVMAHGHTVVSCPSPQVAAVHGAPDRRSGCRLARAYGGSGVVAGVVRHHGQAACPETR
jgi:hypothetical protein